MRSGLRFRHPGHFALWQRGLLGYHFFAPVINLAYRFSGLFFDRRRVIAAKPPHRFRRRVGSNSVLAFDKVIPIVLCGCFGG